MTYSVIVISVLLLGADKPASDTFSAVEIERPFDRYLLANQLLMEVTGAKVVTLPHNKCLIVAVASCVMKDNSATDRLRAERVCRTKALAYVVQERKGVQVFHSEESTDKTVIINVNGKETGKNVCEYLEVTRTKVEGIAKDMPVVGRWRSKDGEVFYLAIGAFFDQDGKRLPTTR